MNFSRVVMNSFSAVCFEQSGDRHSLCGVCFWFCVSSHLSQTSSNITLTAARSFNSS